MIHPDYTQQDLTPRCPACGAFMELVDEFNGGRVYGCCGHEKSVPKPWRLTPTQRERYL